MTYEVPLKRSTVRTHCVKGHAYAQDNVRIHPKLNCRLCITCERIARDRRMFGGNREKAIQRDGEKCVKCGMTRDEHREKFKTDITVDHIDGKGNGVPLAQKNNDLSNLQTLCHNCHMLKDTTTRKLSDVQVINIKHIGKAATAKQIADMYGVCHNTVSRIRNGKFRRTILRGLYE